MPFLAQHQQTPNFMHALLRDHQRYLPIVEWLDALISQADQLTWSECEHIGKDLAAENGSDFCVGIRSNMITALATDGARPRSGQLAPVLAYARKLNLDSRAVSDADIQPMRNAGWSDQTVEDVAGLVAALKTYSLLANGLGFGPLPAAELAETAAATVQMSGYTPVFQSFINQQAPANN